MKNLLLISMLIVFSWSCKKSDTVLSPAVLTTTAVTGITASTASTGGDITNGGGSMVSQRGVCYAIHANPTVSDSITHDGSGAGTFTSSLQNLYAKTTYYVRAYAINQSGTGYGAVDSFTTSAGAPTITTAAVSNIQGLTALSGWTLVNNGGAGITGVGLVWSTSPHPTISDNKISDSLTKTSSIDTLFGLSLGTIYVRSYATNSFGTGYGNELSFTVTANGAVTDIDGNAYLTVVIGTQTWITSNLKVTHYLNGDPIVNGLATNFNWIGAINDNGANLNVIEGAYTFPNGDSSTKQEYGLLYNSFVVNDPRGVCPAGWHVPYETDWQILGGYLGGTIKTDTLYMTVNNGSSGNFGTNTLAPKLLTGGSSGLNLQLAGLFHIGSPNSYKGFTDHSAGYYLGASIAGYPDPTIEPLFGVGLFTFDLQISTGTNVSNVNFQFDNTVVCSIRCLKN